MASREKVGLVVAMLAEAFARPTSPALFEAYHVALGDLPDRALDVAGTAVLRASGRFMPTPGELRALALTAGRGIEAQVDEAWHTVCTAIDRWGGGRSVNFRDALINATVRYLGGWEYVCRRPVEEFEKWFKRDFIATYTRFLQVGCPAKATGYLVGEVERANAGWIGRTYGRGQRFELPAPAEVAAPYVPQIESRPVAEQIARRPADVPRLELQRVGSSGFRCGPEGEDDVRPRVALAQVAGRAEGPEVSGRGAGNDECGIGGISGRDPSGDEPLRGAAGDER